MKYTPTARTFTLMPDELLIEWIWNRIFSLSLAFNSDGTTGFSMEIQCDLSEYVQNYFNSKGYVLTEHSEPGDNYWTIATP